MRRRVGFIGSFESGDVLGHTQRPLVQRNVGLGDVGREGGHRKKAGEEGFHFERGRGRGGGRGMKTQGGEEGKVMEDWRARGHEGRRQRSAKVQMRLGRVQRCKRG